MEDLEFKSSGLAPESMSHYITWSFLPRAVGSCLYNNKRKSISPQPQCQEVTGGERNSRKQEKEPLKGTFSTQIKLRVTMGCSWPNIVSMNLLIFQ